MSNFVFNVTATLSASRGNLGTYPGEHLYILRGNAAYLPFDLADKYYNEAARTCSEIVIRLRQSDIHFSEYLAEIYDGELVTEAVPGMPYFEYICSDQGGTAEAEVNLLTLVLPADFTITNLESSSLAGPLYFEAEVRLKDVEDPKEIINTVIEPQFPIMVRNSLAAGV